MLSIPLPRVLKLLKFIDVHAPLFCTLHRGAFCQFLFRWIYYSRVVNPPERKMAKHTSVHLSLHSKVM